MARVARASAPASSRALPAPDSHYAAAEPKNSSRETSDLGGRMTKFFKRLHFIELFAKKYLDWLPKVISENGGANLPVCRGAQQGAAHHFGNDFWQSL